MNCDIKSEGMVHVSGRFGIIVGGSVRAIQEVEATMIGNMAEIPTTIEVGTSEELPKKLKELDVSIKKYKDEISHELTSLVMKNKNESNKDFSYLDKINI